jgi:hypothetical protein
MDKLLFHHCTNLSTLRYDTIVPSEQHTSKKEEINGWDDEDLAGWDVRANNWLKNEVGFYPLFMAVGSTLDDLYATGYSDNWRVTLSSWFDKKKNKQCYTSRKKGEFPNQVLFSFKNIDCVFMDCDWWIVTGYNNSFDDRFETTEQDKRRIFKYSWSRSKWLRRAANAPESVICVVPKLDLRQADRIWVRNQKTKKIMEKKGFENVFSKRIPVD